MAVVRISQVSKLILACCWLVCCNATNKVQFFEEEYFKGYSHDETSPEQCTNLPTWFANANGSLKTPECIMVFKERDCIQAGFKVLDKEPQLNSLEYKPSPLKNYNFHVNSFRNCSIMESRPQIDVDIHNAPNQKGEIIARFRDICTCKNLPKFTLGNSISANTYGNCIRVFERRNCEGNFAYGFQDDSSNSESSVSSLWYHIRKTISAGGIFKPDSTTFEEPLSIQPCTIPLHCYRLKATVTSFAPLSNVSNIPNSIKEVAIAAKQTFRNNGTATLEDNYDFTKRVVETAKFQFSSGFRQNISVHFAASTETTFPLLDGVVPKLRADVLSKFHSANFWNQTNESFVENVREFRVQKRISVPPCTEYEVTSFVQVAQNVQMDYLVQLQVTGEVGSEFDSERMTVKDIRQHLTNLTFVSIGDDNNTVIAEANAKLTVSYGLNSVFNGVGVPIVDCLMRHKQCTCMR